MDDDLPIPSPQLIEDFLVRFRIIARQINRADDMIREGREMRESAEADLEKLRGGADVFGIDLLAELNARQHAQIGQPTVSEQQALPPFMKRFTVRDFILEQAEAAHPDAVRAADLRKQFQQITGQVVHEKTFGMTLYRLSQEMTPAIRRVGHADWFFIPPPERKPRFRPTGVSLAELKVGGEIVRLD